MLHTVGGVLGGSGDPSSIVSNYRSIDGLLFYNYLDDENAAMDFWSLYNFCTANDSDFEQEKAELRSLARRCGIPESQCNTLSALGLISAIRIKLDNSEDYYGSTFSSQELELLSNLVSDEPELMQRIRKYDDYIKKLKGHRVILLP